MSNDPQYTYHAPPSSVPPPSPLPQRRSNLTKRVAAVLLALFCGVYLVYPSFGLFELIPDTLPIVGNLDEASATTLLLGALSYLGINLVPFSRRDDEPR